MKFMLLLFLIRYCRSERCTFLSTINYSLVPPNIVIENVSIPKLCTDKQITNNYKLNPIYIFNRCEIKELGTNLFKNYAIGNIVMHLNSIKTLRSFTFYKIDVYSIVLSTNGIVSIEENAFYKLHNLSSISLENNKIKVLNPTAFHKLPHLTQFSVQNNEISILKKNTFHFMGSNNFTDIDFSMNEITTIESHCFNDVNIKMLYISNNSLEALNKTSFKNVNIGFIYLRDKQTIEDLHICEYEHIPSSKLKEKCRKHSSVIVGYFVFEIFLLGIISTVVVTIVCKILLKYV